MTLEEEYKEICKKVQKWKMLPVPQDMIMLYNNSSIYLDRKFKTYLNLVERSKNFRKEYNYV